MFSGYYIKGSSMATRYLFIALGYRFIPRRFFSTSGRDFEMMDEDIDDVCIVVNVKRCEFWLADDTLINIDNDEYFYRNIVPNDRPGPLPSKILGYQKVETEDLDLLLEKCKRWKELSK